MPVLSRLYNPADFGLLAIFLAVSGIVATAITLRFDAAILPEKDDHDSKTLVFLSLALALLVGILIGLIIWLVPDSFKSSLGVLVLNEWLILAVFCGMSLAILNTASAWYNRQRAYVKMVTLRVTQSMIIVILSIAYSLWGIQDGLMLAQICASLSVAAIAMVGLGVLGLSLRLDDFRIVAVKHNASPKYLLPAALLDVATLQLPVLLITAWFSYEDAGQFSMAWKILGLPTSLVGAAIGQVFLQRFAQNWPDVQEAKALLYRTWRLLALIGLLPTLLIMLYGRSLFSWVLGDAWGPAGEMASVMAPMLFAMLISSPTSGIFLVLKLQSLSLYFGISFLIYRVACIYLGVLLDNILIGFFCWVICELIAIAVYNIIALRKMVKNEKIN
jgi:O-antigen/teichoic acid export membrane protein